jgi:hypothetical protein
MRDILTENGKKEYPKPVMARRKKACCKASVSL